MQIIVILSYLGNIKKEKSITAIKNSVGQGDCTHFPHAYMWRSEDTI